MPSAAWLTAGALALAGAVALAPLLGRSPLLVGTLVCGVIAAVALVRHPVAATLLTLTVMLLPPGVIPSGPASVLADATLLVALVAWVTDLTVSGRTLRGGVSVVILAMFFLWSLVTVFWAADLTAARRAMVQYAIFALVLVLVLSYVRSRAALDNVMDVFALAGWMFVLASLWSLLDHGYSAGSRLQVFQVNDNQLGNMIIVLTPGVLWRAMRLSARSTWHVLAAHLYVVSALAIIVLSGSRGSLLAFLLMTVAFGAARPTRRWAAIAVVGAAGLLVAAPFLYGTVADRFVGSSGEASRPLLWSAGLALIAEHPVGGVGVGNGDLVMPQFIDRRTDVDHFVDGRTTYPAHDPLIEVGTDSGTIGITLYAGFISTAGCAFALRLAQARRARDAPALGYCAAVVSASLAFLLVWAKSGGESSNVSTLVLVLLWLMPVGLSFASQEHAV